MALRQNLQKSYDNNRYFILYIFLKEKLSLKKGNTNQRGKLSN